MDGLGKIFGALKTGADTSSTKIEVKREGLFGPRKVVVGEQKIFLKDLVAKINHKIENLINKLDENPNLNNIAKEIKTLHEYINKTKQLDRLDKTCFGFFSKIFGNGLSGQIKTTQDKLSSLSDAIQLKFKTKSNAKTLIFDKNPKFDVLNLKRAGISNIAREFSSIESELQIDINKLPAADQILAKEKLAIMKEMVEYASTLKQYSFKPQIIEKLIIYRVEIKNEGISSSFPDTLGLDPNNSQAAEKGLIVDANGKPFDNLRENGKKPDGSSAAEKKQAFIASRGGDNQVITKWLKNQGTSSWSPESRYVRDIFSSFRNVPPDKIWEGPPLDTKLWPMSEDEIREMGTAKESDIETILMHMAFVHELLTKIDFPGKNKDGTVTLYRTENKTVLDDYGINEISSTKEHLMKRAFDGSFSIIRPVIADGTEVTEQRVPIVLTEASYLLEKMFKDSEMEFVCQSDDIPFKYTHSLAS